MRRWFLSYHSPDKALADGLAAAIERRDRGSSVFLAQKSLRAGGYWQKVLADEIAQADAFILLVGPNGIGPWQIPEYNEAQDRSVEEHAFRVILVLLEGQTAPGLPFLRQFAWIITADPTSEKDLGRLIDAATGTSSRPGELWRYTSPYRGLAAMTEADSDFFFGRERETIEVLKALAGAPDRLPVLLGNSGVGKSSLAQAGVLAAFKRQAWPERASTPGAWPAAFRDSRCWCFLKLNPGTEPLRALVESFLDTWQFATTDPERVKQQNGWIELLRDGKGTLRDLLDATERRYFELGQAKPAAFFLYVDQGEELYVRSEERQRRRFSELMAQALRDPRLRVLMSLRADFSGALQNDEPLFEVYHRIEVPPLREVQLRDVVIRPAELLSARFETDHLASDIAQRTAEESTKDAGALPLLSYLLDDMWSAMIARGDGVLQLPAAAMEIGGVLAERANAFLSRNPTAERPLRRVFTLKLATVREDGEPTRRRAVRSEFTDEEWRLVSELADHPNRLLVTATPEAGETYAEVAHEAIFRRWDRLREWIAAEREFLAWRSGLEAARRAWQATPARSKNDALLMGLALAQARKWRSERADDIPERDRAFIALSHKGAQRRKLRVQALVGVLAAAIFAGFAAYWNEQALRGLYYRFAHGSVLTAQAERMLKPGKTFWECVKTEENYSRYCPEMVVVPAGKFLMGSPTTEKDRLDLESPQHEVTISRSFAVSKFELTFDQWEACVQYGGCSRVASTFGSGKQPVINVGWADARQYVRWLSGVTGQPYRLLTEAEWEYAERAGTTDRYSFDGDESALGEHAWHRRNSNGRTHPVGEKMPNAFGLHDMHGNVWEWVEDCYHNNFKGAPADGSAWTEGDCSLRVLRGGSWGNDPPQLRSAYRIPETLGFRSSDLAGFRVARTLAP
jgi:formylglycine-generating enzyme required for sulfatase activity